jgi:hypothetical protein
MLVVMDIGQRTTANAASTITVAVTELVPGKTDKQCRSRYTQSSVRPTNVAITNFLFCTHFVRLTVTAPTHIHIIRPIDVCVVIVLSR